MAASEKDGTGSGRRPSHGDDTARRVRRGRASKPGKHSAAWAMRTAAEQLEELLGRAPESVSAIKPTEEGWEADVEVLELERVPETTSVLGTYHVTLDEEGDLLAYERIRRYTRGQIDRRR
ncbi:gas vesicle protein [Streptomyces sp. Ag109_G2-15]|uniref:gas vesicle protein GvpO n=1 Tax=Streptomyces sp. Ag109_G2-15 TaxID=1938850 RepID=UPI000BCA15A2|nr:gas vesicle protein [Streptomyces sp. Ag109_G2-15]SOE06699.1 Gas vesicle synthesis protein GvpO [Streptomyces sp. Ag109_G2-15]